MRIAVTGTTGQVTCALREAGKGADLDIFHLGRPDLDLTRPDTLLPALKALAPHILVSAAAYTAVDRAESEPELAFAVNATGAGALAQAAAVLGVPIIHLSTDYVFDGTKPSPYAETDPTGPVSVYGASKLEGERRVAAATADHVILRTAWVYSTFGNNFVKTMLRLGETRSLVDIVADQSGCPSSAHDLAKVIIAMAEKLCGDKDPALRGIFHVAGSGEASWAQFAQAIFATLEARTGKTVSVRPISTAQYPTAARRPENSRLDCQKLERLYGLRMPDWHGSTETVVKALIDGRGDKTQ
jgi:dTDP-4-dehydrorhamnose reductase